MFLDMKRTFPVPLMIVLQALLSALSVNQHDAFVYSFTIPIQPLHSHVAKRFHINFVTSIVEPRSNFVGPLFAKKRKKKKNSQNSKSNASQSDLFAPLTSIEESNTSESIKDFKEESEKERKLLVEESSDIFDANSKIENISIEEVKTRDGLKLDDTNTSTGSSLSGDDNAQDDKEIASKSKVIDTSTATAGTITDVLNTLLEGEENRSTTKIEGVDVSAYKLYLQWVEEQEKGQKIAPSQQNTEVYNLYLDWVKEQEVEEDLTESPQNKVEKERVQKIMDDAKMKFAEEDKVQTEQLEAAKLARERVEEQGRIQAEELKKRFAEEDKVQQQNMQTVEESKRRAEEQEKLKTEALKQKFQDEDKNQATILKDAVAEEPILFPELSARTKMSSLPELIDKKNKDTSLVGGRTWMSASEKIKLSRAESDVKVLSDTKEIPDSVNSIEKIPVNDIISEPLLADSRVDNDEKRAEAISSERFQRELLKARFKLNKYDLITNNVIDNEISDNSSQESLIAARMKLDEIRMQKPSQKPKADSSVKANTVAAIQNENGTVEAFLDSFVAEKSQVVDAMGVEDKMLEYEPEDHDHHDDHEDIDMTDSILTQYGSIDEFMASINGSQEGDADDDEDVDMTDSIIAQFGSVEAFFATFGDGQNNKQAPSEDEIVEDFNEQNIPEVYETPIATIETSSIESAEDMEQVSGHETAEDDECDMTGSIIAQRHVYRLSPSEGAVRSAFTVEDRQYFKVQRDNSLELYGDRCITLRGPSEKSSIFDFQLGPALLTINGLQEDHDLDDESRKVMWHNTYATMLYCIANPFIIHGEGLGVQSCTGLVGILSILGLGHAYPANADASMGNNNAKSSLTPKSLNKFLMTDASENNILKCIDNLQQSSFPANKVNLGLLDPSEDVAKNMFRGFDFVLSCDCAKDPYGLATVFATTLKEGPDAIFVHVTSIEKDQKRLKNAVDSRLRIFSRVDDFVLEKLNLAPLVFVTQDEANVSIQNVDSPVCHEDLEVKEAESLLFTALTGYQRMDGRQIKIDNADFVDNDTW